jgi:serine/threonine protein phosphatase 1
MRVYAIGDIHGQLEMLQAAHEKIARDRKQTGDTTAPVIHLGDLTDRGPDSKGVLDFLIDGLERNAPWITIKGNHDRMFAQYLRDPVALDPAIRSGLHWLHPRIGGLETLASYGTGPDTPHADIRTAVPERHKRFLASLPLMYRTDDLAFVHAGIRPGIPLDQQVEDDLVWIREAFHDVTTPHEALIVHGHTPVDIPTHYGNRVNLDTGAGYGKPLTVAVFEGTTCHILENTGRTPLVP